jgi:hypothetical protein
VDNLPSLEQYLNEHSNNLDSNIVVTSQQRSEFDSNDKAYKNSNVQKNVRRSSSLPLKRKIDQLQTEPHQIENDLDSFIILKNNTSLDGAPRKRLKGSTIQSIPGISSNTFQISTAEKLMKKSSILCVPSGLEPKKVLAMLLYNLHNQDDSSLLLWISRNDEVAKVTFDTITIYLKGIITMRCILPQDVTLCMCMILVYFQTN